MISNCSQTFVALLLVGVSNPVAAFDVCNSDGYRRLKLGELRFIQRNGNSYVDYRVKKADLETDEPPMSQEMISAVARDAAVTAFYDAFKAIVRPPAPDADLRYAGLESFVSRCSASSVFFGYTVAVKSLSWVGNERKDGGMPPSVRALLPVQQLVD